MLQADQARVKEFLIYDEATGVFKWKKLTGRAKVGLVAGTYNPGTGYWYVRLDGKRFAAHRLAWFYTHGVMPPADIDHINGDRADNRIANLRLATRSQNLHSSRPHKSASGLKGAYLYKWRLAAGYRRPWSSKIQQDQKVVHLGYFSTREEAHAAYMKAARELYGEFARAI